MNIKNILQKLNVSSLPRPKKIGKDQLASLSVGALFCITFGVLLLDGYVFYASVLADGNEEIPISRVVFPEKEVRDVIEVIDQREQKFQDILSGGSGTTTPKKQ